MSHFSQVRKTILSKYLISSIMQSQAGEVLKLFQVFTQLRKKNWVVFFFRLKFGSGLQISERTSQHSCLLTCIPDTYSLCYLAKLMICPAFDFPHSLGKVYSGWMFSCYLWFVSPSLLLGDGFYKQYQANTSNISNVFITSSWLRQQQITPPNVTEWQVRMTLSFDTTFSLRSANDLQRVSLMTMSPYCTSCTRDITLIQRTQYKLLSSYILLISFMLLVQIKMGYLKHHVDTVYYGRKCYNAFIFH